MFENIGNPDLLANDPCLNCQRLFCDEKASDCNLVQIDREGRRQAYHRTPYKDVQFHHASRISAEALENKRRRSREYHRQKRQAFKAAMAEIDAVLNEYIRTGRRANEVDRIYQECLERARKRECQE